MAATLEHVEQEPGQVVPAPYSKRLLFGGTVGRIWLWFVAGCLAVTLIPMLFGWRPYVIQSGSMMPRIKVGDIVIASPNHDPKLLLGHVTVFQDPDFPNADRMKTHRVIQIAKDGQLVTKGDANQSADSVHVPLDKVAGIGRLMVRWAGLPLVWAHTGKWLYLFLFGLSLYLSALVVARDREPYEDDEVVEDELPEDDVPEDDGATKTSDAEPVVPPQRQPRADSRLLGMDSRALKRTSRRLLLRSTALLGLALILALPTARAAFSAVTRNTGDSWSVPNWDYTTEAKALGPYIYYKLDEASASGTADDQTTSNFDGTYNGAATNYLYQQPGAFTTDLPDTGVTQRNANSCIYTPAAASRPTPGPATYSEIVWFKTAVGYNVGGKLVGFETARTGVSTSGQYDRHVYMDGAGKLWFGVWLTATSVAKAISTPLSYNDGNWHMMVATMGTTATGPGGMRLYVDGVLRASDVNTTSETFGSTGYWRFGCGNLSGWGLAATWTGPNAPTAQANVALQGSLDEVAVYHSQLTAAQIAFLYATR